jgi:outer membrane protein assembly factor BamB
MLLPGMLALDAATGKTLWHTYGGGAVQSAPITYELDGRQYVLIGSSGVLYSWSLHEALRGSDHLFASASSWLIHRTGIS